MGFPRNLKSGFVEPWEQLGRMAVGIKANLKPDAALPGQLLDNELMGPGASAAPGALPGSGPLSSQVLKAWQDESSRILIFNRASHIKFF